VPRPSPVLSIVVPTLNERDNVAAVVEEVAQAFAATDWEIIFVDDDSRDRTAWTVREIAARDDRVRCLQRIRRRGLASACIEGMLASTAPYVAVMDGDLQHDPRVLPGMLELLRSDSAEIVVGSRYVKGGSVQSWSAGRQRMSRLATRLGRRVLTEQLTDPMSGVFMLRRELIDEVVRRLSGLGFKLLLDIFLSARRSLVYREVPVVFRNRVAGETKLDELVVWEYLMLLADKTIGRYVPVRFLAFALIGALGLGVHFVVLSTLYLWAGTEFPPAQAIATAGAMVFNYTLNNVLTYRDRRRRGLAWFYGLASFTLACSAGALANVGIATYVFYREAGWILAAVTGVAVGAVWNYAVSSVYTWGSARGT
jgi:dolichol-phosphate mannosyltransferase